MLCVSASIGWCTRQHSYFMLVVFTLSGFLFFSFFQFQAKPASLQLCSCFERIYAETRVSRPIVGCDDSCDLVSWFFSWGCFAWSRAISWGSQFINCCAETYTLQWQWFAMTRATSKPQCNPSDLKPSYLKSRGHISAHHSQQPCASFIFGLRLLQTPKIYDSFPRWPSSLIIILPTSHIDVA